MGEAVHRLLHREGEHALPLESRGQFVPPGEITDLTQVAPVDHRGRQAESPAVMGQSIEGGVGGGIVGLAGMAEDA